MAVGPGGELGRHAAAIPAGGGYCWNPLCRGRGGWAIGPAVWAASGRGARGQLSHPSRPGDSRGCPGGWRDSPGADGARWHWFGGDWRAVCRAPVGPDADAVYCAGWPDGSVVAGRWLDVLGGGYRVGDLPARLESRRRDAG